MIDSRLVVLGATGFVGRYITQHGIATGWNVLSLGSRDINLQASSAVDDLTGLLTAQDIVVHSAAIAPAKSAEDVIANLAMTRTVATALKNSPVAHLILVSSDAVYGNASGVIDETSPCNADSLHGVMSLGRELLCREAGIPGVTVVRPAPIYGIGDTHNSYGPNRFAKQAIDAGQITIFGEGESKRDHVTVEDVAGVILRCASDRAEGTVNVASGVSVSFAEMAEMVAGAAGRDTSVSSAGSESSPSFRTFDIARLVRRFPDLVPTGPHVGVGRMIAAMRESVA